MASLSNADRLKTLTRQEATVLYWKCYGLIYANIGKRLGYGEDRVTQIMSNVYRKLGFEEGMHWTRRTRLLSQTFCKEFNALIGGKSANIENWPLYGEGTTEGVRHEEPKPDATMTALVLYDEQQLTATAEVVEGEVAEEVGAERERKETRQLGGPGTKKKGGGTCLTRILVGLGVLATIAAVGGAAYYFGVRQGQTQAPVTTSVAPTDVSFDTAIPAPSQEISAQVPATIPQIIVVTATPPPPTDMPTLTPLPQPQVLFADDFEQGLSGSWRVESGNPIVVNGQLTSDGNTWVSIGDSAWTDYTVRFDVQPHDCWFYDTWSAIGVRVSDSDNMIAFMLASCTNEWNMVRNGTWQAVPNSGSEVGSNDMVVVITVEGSQFSVNIDGERASSFFNSDFPQGGVALRVGDKSLIDNFKVTALEH